MSETPHRFVDAVRNPAPNPRVNKAFLAALETDLYHIHAELDHVPVLQTIFAHAAREAFGAYFGPNAAELIHYRDGALPMTDRVEAQIYLFQKALRRGCKAHIAALGSDQAREEMRDDAECFARGVVAFCDHLQTELHPPPSQCR